MTDKNFEKDINITSKRPPYEIALMHDHIKRLEEELKAKEQECEELKRENELAKQLINWILKFFELTDYDWQYDQNEISFLIKDCMDDKQSTIDFVTDINKELLAKLTEIKEIVKEQLPTVNYNFAKSMHPEMFNCYEQILQKISECEV